MTYKWSPADMVEVTLREPDDFLKVKETLTRIGIASKHRKELFQSCHILHKQGHYFIVHFKELFQLDGKPANFTENDAQRRNTIALLLADWGLVTLAKPIPVESRAAVRQIKIVPFREKHLWVLTPKYTIGRK